MAATIGAGARPWQALAAGAASGENLGMAQPTLAVVVPVFEEAESLPAFHERLMRTLAGVEARATVLYVDDGSRDATPELLADFARRDPRVGVLRLSRNFGKEAALTAGLDHVEADAVVVIDADLQDPPELIPAMLERWRAGAEVVFGRRVARAGDGWFKRLSAHLFYRLLARLSDTPIPPDVGDFRLLDRRAHRAVVALRERNRFMKGLFAWIGFRQEALPYRREPRRGGRSKWRLGRLWSLAVDGITAFSSAPLRLAGPLGLLVASLAFGYGAVIIAKTLLYGDPVPGYPSLMVVILFLGGVQLVALGILGEYLARLYLEAKGRPIYLVERLDPPRYDGPGRHSEEGEHADRGAAP
ncbi:MAG: glycosyltransferase family 2 protein [Xanthomonadales bacterium]|nr:glycosyltransferase family 2 protein [Xanthomonadales bacterium]